MPRDAASGGNSVCNGLELGTSRGSVDRRIPEGVGLDLEKLFGARLTGAGSPHRRGLDPEQRRKTSWQRHETDIASADCRNIFKVHSAHSCGGRSIALGNSAIPQARRTFIAPCQDAALT